jgi:hypothetical protein
MTYAEELLVLAQLEPRVKRALQRMAFAIRAGTAEQQALYDAIFANQTVFTAAEATLLAFHFSYGDNDLRVLGAGASDAQIQTCVDAIVSELMTRQAARTLITGL